MNIKVLLDSTLLNRLLDAQWLGISSGSKHIMGHNTIKRQLCLWHTACKYFWQSAAHKLSALIVVMLITAVASIAFFKSSTYSSSLMAGTVSVAGKLRLLSHKIELDIAHYAHAGIGDPTAVLSGLADFDAALDALTYGGSVFSTRVQRVDHRHRSALDAVRTEWQHYRAAVQAILANTVLTPVLEGGDTGPRAPEPIADGTALRDNLSLSSFRLLHASENMVDGIVKDMQQRQGLATMQMYTAFALLAVSFLLIMWFIRRRIAQPLALLQQGARQLAGGEYHVHLNYPVSDDMGQLIQIFNRSAQTFASLLHDLEYSHDSLKRAETMFRGVVENSGISVYVSSERRFLFVNQELAKVLGYEHETMMADLGPQDIFVDDDAQIPVHTDTSGHERRAARAGVLRRGRRRDGSLVDFEVFESVMTLEEETVSLCVALDVTQRRQDEASARLARLVYEVSSEGMVITDADGYIVHINPAFTKITGYETQDVLGKKMSLLSSGRHGKSFYEGMWASIQRTGSWVGEIWNRRKNGEEFAERLSINTSYDDNGKVQHRVGLFSDITARKKTDELIWRQANFDTLTDLPNRQRLHDKLDLAMTRARAGGTNVALAFLDLDHFKDVNDTLGHHCGDELLKQVAVRIDSCLRTGDTVGRQGGDEFMIIVTGVDSAVTADGVCKRVMAELAKPFVVHGDVVNVTASLGVTLFPQDGDNTAEMFKNADMAMYEAKALGRNQYCWFKASMQEKVALRQRLSRELSEAVDLQQFSLVYQPIIDLHSGTVSKAEALIRWDHPERGQISPADFIPFAEDFGAIDAIGEWVFETAIQQADQWRNIYGDDFQVTINVSPVQFLSDDSGLSKWSEKLRDLEIQGSSLVVEITEGLLMDACGTVTRRLNAFQKGGIQVALDDFGTGYSSLAYLKKFDIDYIKIDRTFVANLGPDTDERALCDAIVVMAHRLGLKVIAEGIETPEQYQLLAESGCDYGQGFLFGKAIDPVRFGEVMSHRYEPPGHDGRYLLN